MTTIGTIILFLAVWSIVAGAVNLSDIDRS